MTNNQPDRPDIAKEIRNQVQLFKQQNIQPAFILLGKQSYWLLCSYVTKIDRALGTLEEDSFAITAELEGIPIVFDPNMSEFYVRVLPNATDTYLYLSEEKFYVDVSDE